MNLTDLKVKHLKPAPKPKKYADGEGLFLYVTPKGAKSWRFRYRSFSGKHKEMTFGLYPEVSLLEAREKRSETRKLIAIGKDPIEEKITEERALKQKLNNTLNKVAEEWHELNLNKWSERHANTIMFRLKRYVFPKLGDRAISDITALDILELLRDVEKEEKYELCHRLLQYLTGIFRLAVLTQRITVNPCTDLKGVLKVGTVTHRPSINIKELPALLKSLESSGCSMQDKIAVKLIMLIFVRPTELRKSKWAYIDFDKKQWCIPPELMKMQRPHIVPLASQTIELLKQLKEITGDSEYLFPTKNFIKHPYMNMNTINNLLKKLGMKKTLCSWVSLSCFYNTLRNWQMEK